MSKKIPCVTATFPVFSMYGKNKNQIPTHPDIKFPDRKNFSHFLLFFGASGNLELIITMLEPTESIFDLPYGFWMVEALEEFHHRSCAS